MFERFTDRARHVVVLAQSEARLLNHDYIGTEHVLLGLIHEREGVAAQALSQLDVSLESVRSRVEEMIGRGEGAPGGHIPFTPRAKKVLELALRKALDLGHDYIGTEHILLGLVREGEGVAAQVLTGLGADRRRVRDAVVELLGAAGVSTRSRPRRGWRGRRLEGPQIERLSVTGAICPTCRAALMDAAAHQRLTVKGEGDDLEVIVVYCTRCGRALGTSPI
jgi:ATP-dependent Clp protease ATP-binding subunit ClpA